MERRTVDFHPEAVAEGREARDWYLARSPQAEELFRAELELAIELIRDRPEAWPRYLHDTRRTILKRFPYSLVYTTNGKDSLVIALAHAARRPGYWRSRLP